MSKDPTTTTQKGSWWLPNSILQGNLSPTAVSQTVINMDGWSKKVGGGGGGMSKLDRMLDHNQLDDPLPFNHTTIIHILISSLLLENIDINW